jgi:CRP-like cAMP-binding protein
VESRFAALFLDLAAKLGRPASKGVGIALVLSRQELADLTGTTLETAIRIMTRWGREELVATCREGFLLRDRSRLEALSWGRDQP